MQSVTKCPHLHSSTLCNKNCTSNSEIESIRTLDDIGCKKSNENTGTEFDSVIDENCDYYNDISKYIECVLVEACNQLIIENQRYFPHKLNSLESQKVLENKSDDNNESDVNSLKVNTTSSSEATNQDINSQNPEIEPPEFPGHDQVNSTDRSMDGTKSFRLSTESSMVNIGLENPRAFCYLNSVVQVLRNFCLFAAEMIRYYETQREMGVNGTTESIAYELGQLYYHMSANNNSSVQDCLGRFQLYFDNSMQGDDIHKCYLQLLNEINLKVKAPRENPGIPKGMEKNEAELKFIEFQSKNYGFVFDQFCGQISFQSKCESCQTLDNEKFQLFRSMPLQIPFSNEKIPIEDCIRNFLMKSKICGGDYNCCKNANMYSFPKISHVPKYLFIYLTRGSYKSFDDKNETFVDFQNEIIIPTTKGLVSYLVISVIDHVGRNECGHYFAKTYSNSSWWLKNDTYVEKILWNQVVTRNSIGLFLEKIPYNGTGWNRMVFKNPSSIHWVMQMLLSCVEFQKNVMNISEKIGDKFHIPELLLSKIVPIIQNFEQYKFHKIRQLMECFSHIFGEHIEIRDIPRCYIDTLDSIFSAASRVRENQLFLKKETVCDAELNNFKRDTFEFEDLYSAMISSRVTCNYCKKVFSESLEVQRAIPIQLYFSGNNSLQDCIAREFQASKIDGDYNCCHNPCFVISKKIMRFPKYLFIYLIRNRSSYSFVNSDSYVEIFGENGLISYKIRSIIDSNRGKYLFKYSSGKPWWINNGIEINEIPWSEVLTPECIGIFMEAEKYQEYDFSKDFQVNSCFNAIIEMLYFCDGVREMLVESHNKYDELTDIPEEMCFLKKLAAVMYFSKHGKTELARFVMNQLQFYLPNNLSNFEDLCRHILTTIENDYSTDTSKIQDNHLHKCGLFTGATVFQTRCEKCKNVSDETIQLFQFIKLSLLGTEGNIQNSIENYFEKQRSECCGETNICSVRNIIRPKYLLFYLSKETDCKYDLYLEKNIVLSTRSGAASYSLLSFMNCISTNDDLYYFVKIVDESCNPHKDFEKSYIREKILFSKNVIGFTLEFKECLNHSINSSLNSEHIITNTSTMPNVDIRIQDKTNVYHNSQSSCSIKSDQIPQDLDTNSLSNDVAMSKMRMDISLDNIDNTNVYIMDTFSAYNINADPSVSLPELNKVDHTEQIHNSDTNLWLDDNPMSQVGSTSNNYENTIGTSTAYNDNDVIYPKVNIPNSFISELNKDSISVDNINTGQIPHDSDTNSLVADDPMGQMDFALHNDGNTMTKHSTYHDHDVTYPKDNSSNSIISELNKDSISMDIYWYFVDDLLPSVYDEIIHENNECAENIQLQDFGNLDGVIDESDIIKSIEILFSEINNVNCFSSIITMLFACKPFRDRLVEYHSNGTIAQLNLNSFTKSQHEDIFFVNDVCRLFISMIEKDKAKIQELLLTFNGNIFKGSQRLDLYQCYSSSVRRIESVLKYSRERCNQALHGANLHPPTSQFCDIFKGELTKVIYCVNCQRICFREHEEICGISLPHETNLHINLEDFINSFMGFRYVNGNVFCEFCMTSNFKLVPTLTPAPDYFFIHLYDRSEIRNPQHIVCKSNDGIIIEINGEAVLYSLCAVIEHKSLPPNDEFEIQLLLNRWWTVRHNGVRPIDKIQFNTGFQIGIMLKKQ